MHERQSQSPGFFASSSIIFAGALVVNVLNYLFTLIMSRILNVEDFGEVAALLSLFLIISVPAAALAMLMAREAASHREKGRSSVERLFLHLSRHTLKAAGLWWIVFLVFVPIISGYLRIPSAPIYVFSLLVPLTLLGSLQSGALQGLQEFYSLSAQNVLGTLVKLLGAIILVGAGFSVAGVMFALVLAALCSFLYGFYVTRIRLPRPRDLGEDAFDTIMLAKLFAGILITSFLLALLSNVDVILAKHYLPADIAGQYGALSTMGKILIYGVGAFISVLLPMAAAAHSRGQGEDKRILGLTLAAVATASIAACIIFFLFPGLVVSLLFGNRYIAIVPYLGIFSIAMGCLALSTTFINYFVATRNTSFMYLLALGIIAEVNLLVHHHDSLAVMTQTVVLASALLLSLMIVNYSFAYRHKPIRRHAPHL